MLRPVTKLGNTEIESDLVEKMNSTQFRHIVRNKDLDMLSRQLFKSINEGEIAKG